MPLTPTLKHAFGGLALAVAIRAMLYFLGITPGEDLTFEIILDTMVIGISLSLSFGYFLWKIKGLISSIGMIDAHVKPVIQKQFYKFIENNLDKLQQIIRDAQTDRGAIIGSEEINAITEILFEYSNAYYDGTDSNPPNKYYSIYPNYLTAHEINIDRTHKPGTRVLLVNKETLLNDFSSDIKKFMEFVSWHLRNKVALKWVEPSIANGLSKKYVLPGNITDIGMWHDRYVILFKPVRDNRVKLYLRFKDSKDYSNSLKYFNDLSNKSQDLTLEAILRNGMVQQVEKRHSELLAEQQRRVAGTLFDFRLAMEAWNDFVNCPKRLKGEAPFLEKIIKDHMYSTNKNVLNVYDVALGTGCESIFLSNKNEIKILSNEISPYFQAVAHQNARKAGVSLNWTDWDWREIAKLSKEKYGDGFYVDMVLLLGNSICLLKNKEEQKKAIQNLYDILTPNGRFLIDERNFEYITNNWEQGDCISENPLRNFRYNGVIMYCGEIVKGFPTNLDKDKKCVTFTYIKVGKDERYQEVDNWKKIIKERREGTLNMYLYGENELEKLLESVGFKNIRVFTDFKEGKREEGDFYTYLAEK